MQQYYNYFTKDIRPSVNTQFNIYSASTHSKAVTPSNNTFISTISNINTKGNNLLNKFGAGLQEIHLYAIKPQLQTTINPKVSFFEEFVAFQMYV